MTSSPNTRRSLIVTLLTLAIAIGAWTSSAAQCNSTGVVMVRFDRPNVTAAQFVIRLRTSEGEQDITVTRDASGKVWREEVEPFDIAGSLLVSAEVPGMRTTCGIAHEKNFRIARKCVAMYSLSAEPLWTMKVNSARDGEEFRYKLNPRIAACNVSPREFAATATPRAIRNIGVKDDVIVKVQRRESFISVLLTQNVLADFQGTARFSQLDPLPTTEAPVTAYARHLKKAQADKNSDLTFSLEVPGGGGQ